MFNAPVRVREVFRKLSETMALDYGIHAENIMQALLHEYELESSIRSKKLSEVALVKGWYKRVDEMLAVYKATDPAWSEVVCIKGCSHCCSMAVALTKEEAVVIADVVKRDKISIDKKKLKLQKGIQPGEWHKLSREDATCVFLKDGLCSIYEHRPFSCRYHFVVKSNEMCDIHKYPHGGIWKWRPVQIVIIELVRAYLSKIDQIPEFMLELLEEEYQ